MPVFDPSIVQVSQIVHDFMFIRINDASLEDTPFNYDILDKNNHIARKGQFKGLLIQLRLSHLKEGRYTLQLSAGDQQPAAFIFDKKSPADSDDMVIRMY